jgi:hypothetical protein
VDNRLDAMVTGIPLKKLATRPRSVRRKFARFRRFIHSSIKIVDGTQGGFSVPKIEQILLQERERGFHADAVIIDYDEELSPVTKRQEVRLELADIYRDLRQMIGRQNVIGWTAAQTQRSAEGLKVIGKDRVAEDYSKTRKATMVLGLGQGEWGEDSIYLWVAKHRFDTQHIGCNIVTDKTRGLIYDREKTRQREIEMRSPTDLP